MTPAVNHLIEKARLAETADAALKFSQAALNVANAEIQSEQVKALRRENGNS